MRAKLKEVTSLLRQRRYLPIPEQGPWLASVVRGHMAYYAVPGQRRRGQRLPHPAHRALAQGAAAPQPENPDQLGADEPDHGPVAASARVMHPFPEARFAATHPR
jgi:hypothetical protein